MQSKWFKRPLTFLNKEVKEMSSIFKVCYAPDFSTRFKRWIKDNISPEMEAINDDRHQYRMDDITECIFDEGYETNSADQAELDSLIDQEVQYLEF